MNLLDWMKTLTWKCDVCHEERPDQFISVWQLDRTTEHGFHYIRNLKYCNDREACSTGVKSRE